MAITLIEEDESQGKIELSNNDLADIEGQVRWAWTMNQTARQDQLNGIETLRKLIYDSYPSEIKFGEQYTLPDLPKAQDVLLTQLSAIYTSNDGLFDCVGIDTKSIANAPKQKAAIVADLDMMKFKDIWEKCSEDYCLSGEFIAYVSYEERKKKRKAKISDLQPIIDGEVEDPKITKMKQAFPTMTKLLVGDKEIEGYLVKPTGDIVTSENIVKKTKTHVYYTVTVYQGTKAIPIKSEDFCYDVQKSNRIEDAYKIWRTYLTPDEILNNKDYDFDDETKDIARSLKNPEDKSLEEAQKLISGYKNTKQTASSQQLIWEKYVVYAPDSIGNQVQLFHYYGDIILADGRELNNYIITTTLGKVIRCEPDPAFIDPFVYYAPKIDPNYRRGIPLLKMAIIFNAIRSNIANVATNILALINNPPMFAQKGQLTAQVNQWQPGSIIEYQISETPNPPQRIDFENGLKASMQVMEYFQETIESATGLTGMLAGEGEQKQKTATELNYVQAGSQGRFGYLTDKIKRGFILSLIEKIADIKAVHEFDDINLNIIDKNGNPEDIVVDSLVRNGNYKYDYHDDKTTAEIKQRFQEFMQFTQQFAQTGLVNEEPIFEKGLEMLGLDNPSQYINQSPLDKTIGQALQNVPEAQQQQAKGQLQGMAAQLLQQHLQQMQQQQQQSPQMHQEQSQQPQQIQQSQRPIAQ